MAPVLLNVPCVCNHRPVAYSHLFFTKKFSSIRYVDGEEPSCGPTNRNKEEREREKKPQWLYLFRSPEAQRPQFYLPSALPTLLLLLLPLESLVRRGSLSTFQKEEKTFFFRWLRGTKQKVESPRPSFLLLLLSFRRVCVVSQTHSYNFA